MKIVLLDDLELDGHSYTAGDVVDVPDSEGLTMIDEGRGRPAPVMLDVHDAVMTWNSR